MTTIFDPAAASESGDKKRSESIFLDLSSSSRPGSEASRKLIEEMFARFPADHQNDLRARFRSEGNSAFACAFQELTLHELLLRQNCTLELHPKLSATCKRPDFRVRQADESEFLLEATTVTALATGPLLNPRANRIREFLDHHELDDLLIGIDELSVGKLDLPLKHIKLHVRRTLADIDLRKNGSTALPPLETQDGWRIRLTAIPSVTPPGPGGRIVYEVWGLSLSSRAADLAKALVEKARRYGAGLDRPFVLALSPLDPMFGDGEFVGSLLGRSSLWGSAESPTCTRVSAVLFTPALWPANLLMGHVESRLYLNPFAARPYNGVLTDGYIQARVRHVATPSGRPNPSHATANTSSKFVVGLTGNF
jgi:hypothetical protein